MTNVKRKVVIFSLLLVLMTFLASGCMEVRIHLNLNPDSSADLELLMATSRSLASLDFFKNLKADLARDGFEITDYQEENKVGFRAFSHMDSLEELSSLSIGEGVIANKKDIITVDKGLFTNTYDVEIDFNIEDLLSKEQKAILIFKPDITFAVTLPLRPSQHNATSVSEDGKTLAWKLVPGKTNTIKVTATLPNLTFILVVVILVGILVAALLIIRFRSPQKRPPAANIITKKIHLHIEIMKLTG